MRYSGWHLLGTARMGDDPRDVGARPLEPDPRRRQPVRRRRQLLRHHRPASTPRRRSARSRCAPPTTWSRPGSSSRCRRERGPDRRSARTRPRTLDPERGAPSFAAVAGHLIPAAHGMPSAADVVGDAGSGSCSRAAATSSSRCGPRSARSSGDDPDDPPGRPRAREPDEPRRPALQPVVVGYYTDRDVRDRLGYPGQVAKQVDSWKLPDVHRGGPDRPGARPRPHLARPGDRPAVPTADADRTPRTARRRHRWSRRRLRPPAGSTRSSRLAAGHRRAARDPRAGDRPAAADHRPVHARGRRRAPPRPPRRPPSPPGRRRATRSAPRILRRAAEIYEAHRPEFGTWTQRETGAVHGKMHHEQNFAVGRAPRRRDHAVAALRPARAERRARAALDDPPRPGRRHRRDHARGTRRRVLGMRVVAPALAAGQRGHPQARSRRRRSAAAPMFEAVFREAGPARRAAPRRHRRRRGRARRSSPTPTSTWSRSPGSTEAGRRVGALAGDLLKKVSLELGGNNAFVVLDDADLEAAASRRRLSPRSSSRARSASRPGRHIVHRSVADEYVDLLAEKARRLRARRPVPRGRRPRPDRQRAAARSASTASSGARSTRGARLVEGGTHEGLFYRPTVLADVTTDHAAWTRGGLRPGGAGGHVRHRRGGARAGQRQRVRPRAAPSTRARSRAASRSPSGSRAGMVHVNDQTVNDEATIPFGGMGASGNGGRFGGQANWTSSPSGSG